MFFFRIFIPVFFAGFVFRGCNIPDEETHTYAPEKQERKDVQVSEPLNALIISTAKDRYTGNDFYQQLSHAAVSLTEQHVVYDPQYFSIAYPNGDVPAGRGVCTDVVIRAYRLLGIDLQKEVHEDMRDNFSKYPNKWGLTKPDKNIDHRRVPNLMTFFGRHGTSLTVSDNPENYQPGDVVSWNLDNGLTHIGVVSTKPSANPKRYLIVHNIGAGQVLEDCLFRWVITGHYRYGK